MDLTKFEQECSWTVEGEFWSLIREIEEGHRASSLHQRTVIRAQKTAVNEKGLMGKCWTLLMAQCKIATATEGKCPNCYHLAPQEQQTCGVMNMDQIIKVYCQVLYLIIIKVCCLALCPAHGKHLRKHCCSTCCGYFSSLSLLRFPRGFCAILTFSC